jgi:hypothetical protein
MVNKSKDLRKLFKAYMVRKEEESRRPTYYSHSALGGRNQEYYNNTFQANTTFHGVIFFYEWSDITRDPVRYFSIPLFEKFLTESNLELEPYQKDIMLNLQQCFISCKPGCKDLVIRASYDALKGAMGRLYANTNEQEINRQPLMLPAPYNPMSMQHEGIRISPMYNEDSFGHW